MVDMVIFWDVERCLWGYDDMGRWDGLDGVDDTMEMWRWWYMLDVGIWWICELGICVYVDL